MNRRPNTPQRTKPNKDVRFSKPYTKIDEFSQKVEGPSDSSLFKPSSDFVWRAILKKGRKNSEIVIVSFPSSEYNSSRRHPYPYRLLGRAEVKKRILCVGELPACLPGVVSHEDQQVQIVAACHPIDALKRLYRESFEGVYVSSEFFQQALPLGKFLQNVQILDAMPDGVALLDAENTIVWANQRIRQWSKLSKLEGTNFYTAFGSPELLGPDYCPFSTALATGQPSISKLRSEENRYFQVHAAPLPEPQLATRYLIVTVRDVTEEVLQQQKLAAIHQAGIELADLKPDDLMHMSVEERIELLKSNILHYTKDLLHYDVVEIRLLDPKTGQLAPLLSEGMTPEAARRVLYAQPQGNGVTGFVAATGKSYLCEDTSEDPLYLPGAQGARSSMTVPLVFGDEVIGAFNVESLEPHAFTESDLQFLEIFAREVAAALNTLELLVAEKASTAAASVEAIHGAIALPMDEILNDAVYVMERYLDHPPDIIDRLHRILRNARDIKQLIHKVGEKMAPSEAHPLPVAGPESPLLKGRRVLVVDAEESSRCHVRHLLDRLGCIVDAATDGQAALSLVRTMLPGGGYDVILSDIRLPDMNGFEFMMRLRELLGDPVPLILMAGYGYDPTHSLVKARQANLQAAVFKPPSLDKLLPAVEKILSLRISVSPSAS